MEKSIQYELYRQIGDNIKKRRQSLKLNQTSLAKSINLSRTSLVNIEQGKQHPSVFVLLEISEKLGVTLHDLIPDRVNPSIIPDSVLRQNDIFKIQQFVQNLQNSK